MLIFVPDSGWAGLGLGVCRYSGNPKYIGGAVAFSEADFRAINGFPNTFWGWGGEDDEMRKRIDEVRADTDPSATLGRELPYSPYRQSPDGVLSVCPQLGMRVTSPGVGTMEDLERQSLEEKLGMLKQHRDWKCNVKWEVRP
jgi:hypothetical protein